MTPPSFLLFCLAVVALACSQASARIVAMSVSKKHQRPGRPFKAHFRTTNYIANNDQYTIAFSLTPINYNDGKSLGSSPFQVSDIRHVNKRPPGFDVNVTIPADYRFNNATQYLHTAVFGTVGASGAVTVDYFNTTLIVPRTPSPSSASSISRE